MESGLVGCMTSGRKTRKEAGRMVPGRLDEAMGMERTTQIQERQEGQGVKHDTGL